MTDPAFYREQATKRMSKVLDELGDFLRSEGAPDEVIAKVMGQLDQQWRETLQEQFESGLWSKVEQQNFVDFIDRLLNRHGTQATDFEALCRLKAELDGEPHDPRP